MTEVVAPQVAEAVLEVPTAPAVKKNSVGNFDKMNPDVVPPAELLKEG